MNPLPEQAATVLATLLALVTALGGFKVFVAVRSRNGNGRAEKVITVKLCQEDHDRAVRMEQHMEQHNASSDKILETLHRIEVKQGP